MPGDRTSLAKALRRARARQQDVAEELQAIAESTAGGPDDEHDAEGSTIGYERARVAALLQQASRGVAELEAALARSEEGRYGLCEGCGRAIEEERLAALPTVKLCVSCALRSDRRG